MKALILSANFGGFDQPVAHVPQDAPAGWELTGQMDSELSIPRRVALTPRLQARMVKMWGWELHPGYDLYIWIDASMSLQRSDSAAWLIQQITANDHDLLLFRHPDRHSIREEAEFIRRRVADGNPYLTSRYAGEDIDGQLAAVSDPGFTDNQLYASTVVVYANVPRVHRAFTRWWVHTTRYHAVDQLALPYVLWRYACRVRVPEEHLYRCPYVTHTRNHGWRQ